MTHLFALATFLLTASLPAKTLSMMQYNVENLFDTKFDQGTEDYTYLPLVVKRSLPGHQEYCSKQERGREECINLDWTDAKLIKKVQNIGRVIKAFDKTGSGPDVVVMQEVENIDVLKLLVAKGLAGAGYQYVSLIEGDDTRGIDVGLISKYPIVNSKHHSVFVNGQKLDTRGILEVTLNVNTKTVVLFVNHWPSQNNPVESRIASAQLLEKISGAKAADLIIAAGDFNTLSSDRPAPFESMRSFTDTETLARIEGVRLPPGTHFYRGQWTSLDHIFIHKKSLINADLSTFSIIHHDFIMIRDPKGSGLIPYRFSHQTGEGFSDHLPVGLIFTYSSL
jgi:endonuclease/exonuclease/phosphatase family metal-dependent hydrolase